MRKPVAVREWVSRPTIVSPGCGRKANNGPTSPRAADDDNGHAKRQSLRNSQRFALGLDLQIVNLGSRVVEGAGDQPARSRVDSRRLVDGQHLGRLLPLRHALKTMPRQTGSAGFIAGRQESEPSAAVRACADRRPSPSRCAGNRRHAQVLDGQQSDVVRAGTGSGEFFQSGQHRIKQFRPAAAG